MAGQQCLRDAKKTRHLRLLGIWRGIYKQRTDLLSINSSTHFKLRCGFDNVYMSHHQNDRTSFHMMVEIIPRRCFIISRAAFCILMFSVSLLLAHRFP
jgi:hypothetical protein